MDSIALFIREEMMRGEMMREGPESEGEAPARKYVCVIVFGMCIQNYVSLQQ